MSVIWHDLECGGYHADLALWRELAERHGDPVLEVGAGTGRISLDLASRGHGVIALDNDPALLQELDRRARQRSLDVRAVAADARRFSLDHRFGLIAVPMQTIQLLGGVEGRARFLRCARSHLRPGGALAIAISSRLEPFEVPDGEPGPLPDVCERAGTVYASHPTAVRSVPGGFVLERRRETVSPRGERRAERDRIRLDAVSAPELEREAVGLGFSRQGVRPVPATEEYVGSEVVILGG